jgi:hypothetical protein
MRPNTPHFVLTPESAICHGGHFYAMSTIRDTIFGMYHMFAASRTITNTEHTEDAFTLLRRMVVYMHYILVQGKSRSTEQHSPHVPDVSTFEGALDFFMLCVVMELGDLLNPLAYKKKARRDRDRDHWNRLCTIHSRGLARELRGWWRGCYMFIDPETADLVDGEGVFNDIFSQHMNVLIAYKSLAEEKGIVGEVEECTAAALEKLVKQYFPLVLTPGHRKSTFEWLGKRYAIWSKIPTFKPPCKHPSYVNCVLLTVKTKARMS